MSTTVIKQHISTKTDTSLGKNMDVFEMKTIFYSVSYVLLDMIVGEQL